MAVAGLALRNAAGWYGRPIAGVLVDTTATVSGLQLSTWDAKALDLRFPSRFAAADGVALQARSPDRGAEWDGRVLAAARAGRQKISARVEGAEGSREVELRIRSLDPIAWWAFGGALFFAGVLYVAAGLLAIRSSPRGKLARTFARLAVSCGLFLLTVFDLHTSRALVPVFFTAFAFIPGSFVLLALRLPEDVAWLARHPWVEPAVDAAGLAVAAAFLALHALGRSTTPLQVAWSSAFGAAQVFFALAFLVRMVRARGPGARILRALFVPMVPPYAAAAGFFLLHRRGLWRPEIDVVTFPALALAPLASVYAFIRHDLWGSRALLTRVLGYGFTGAVACALAIAVGTALASELGVPFRAALLTAAISAVLGATLVAAALRWSERALFPARAEYKPTVEQLSTELAGINSPEQVARAVERTVARWLACDEIRIEPEPAPPARAESGADWARRDAQAGDAELAVPVAFEGRPLATLRLGKKRGGALFTSDDVDLIRTIANQGALAFAHALAYQELEERRRQQAAAWRGEREALVETVAAEVAHEVRYPLNFFRSLFERVGRGHALEAEDLDIGREEVDRLERLVSGLRRMAAHRLERKETRVLDLCARAEALLRDSLGERALALDVDASAAVRCDLDQVTQVLVNLLANALDAAGAEGELGLAWEAGSSGAELSVWDTGPGFAGEPGRLFAPWYTTKPRGTGLGLAISLRLARAHGWNLAGARRGARTVFTLSIPSSDVVRRSEAGVRPARVA